MVASLDGYIAKKDNSISWFETTDYYEKGVIEGNPEEFLNKIDCYIMGAKTYELAEALSKNYGWPYGEKPTVVITNRDLKVERKNVALYAGDLTKLINETLIPNYKNVWLVGGSMLAKAFIQLKLVNEIRVTILPILLGEGLPYFNQIGLEQALHLKNTTAYQNGMIELCYEVKLVSKND